MADHRYWRLNISASNGSYITISEIGMYTKAAPATNICTGGTVVASGYYSYRAPESAFDGDINTFWDGDSSTPWIYYRLPVAASVATYSIKLRVDQAQPAQAPKNWTFEASDDGVSWDIKHTVVDQTSWTQGEQRTFKLPLLVDTDVTLNMTSSVGGLSPLFACQVGMVGHLTIPNNCGAQITQPYGSAIVENNVTVDCSYTTTVGQEGWVAINGRYYPLRLIVSTSLEPEWVTKTASLLSGTFSLSGYYRIQDPLNAEELRGIFTLAPNLWLEITIPNYGSPSQAHTPRSDWVAWSKIGSADFTLDRVNDAGERPTGYPGWVYCVKPLGKSIIIYGQEFIAELYPVEQPGPTFGYRVLHDFGLLAKNLVAGTIHSHRYVASDGNIWKLEVGDASNASSRTTSLGYSEFMLPMISDGQVPIMTYDTKNKRYHITNNVRGYILTDHGLGGGPDNITGVQTSDRITYVFPPSGALQDPFELRTDIIDFGVREPKPLQKLSLGVITPELYEFQVHYRMTHQDVFRTTTWKAFNRLGEGWCNVTGTEFKIGLRTTTAVSSKIHSLIAHVRVPDTVFEREAIK